LGTVMTRSLFNIENNAEGNQPGGKYADH
jgi:hypothetical protein